jgi:hypothetical protein
MFDFDCECAEKLITFRTSLRITPQSPGTPENQDFVLAVLVRGSFEMVFDVLILGSGGWLWFSWGV